MNSTLTDAIKESFNKNNIKYDALHVYGRKGVSSKLTVYLAKTVRGEVQTHYVLLVTRINGGDIVVNHKRVGVSEMPLRLISTALRVITVDFVPSVTSHLFSERVSLRYA